jgi:hypothetical protein
LRFQRYRHDTSRIVILGIWPQNIVRNLTQYRALIGDYASPFSFKPRFKVDDDAQLELVPLPEFNASDIASLMESPGEYLQDEYFLPGTTSGAVDWTFPYSLGVLRIMMHERFRPLLFGRPSWSIYYDPNHHSNVLMLTYKIIEQFHTLALGSRKVPLVVVFPSPVSASYFEKTGQWVYEPLLQKMRDNGIDAYHLGPDLLEALEGREFFTLLADGGHFNAPTNELIGDLIFQKLGVDTFAEFCGTDAALENGS